MKRGKTATPPERQSTIVKTISLPKDLAESVESIVHQEPDLNFSAYIRRLIRMDLATRRTAA